MNGKRQKIQWSLASEPTGRGEVPVSGYRRVEPFAAKPAPESGVHPASISSLRFDQDLRRSAKSEPRSRPAPHLDLERVGILIARDDLDLGAGPEQEALHQPQASRRLSS